MARIYELRLVQSMGAAGFAHNVFYYVETLDELPLASNDLWNEFNDTVLPEINTIQWSTVTNSEMMVRSLYDPNDFVIAPLTGAGDLVEGGLPPFVCWSFRTGRKRNDMRRGRKRFVGVTEPKQDAGVVSGTFATELANVADFLAMTLETTSEDGDATFVPITVKRIKEISEEGVVSYRLPITPGEAIYVVADDWAYDKISTQNTRKIGVGV